MIYDDTLPLQFNDPKLDQLEVTAREVDIDTWGRYRVLVGEWITFDPTASEDEAARLAEALAIVAGSLVSWNLTEHDENGVERPVPCDAGGLRSRPKRLVKAIVEAWADAQVGVADPFDVPSTDGAPAAEIPMQSLAS